MTTTLRWVCVLLAAAGLGGCANGPQGGGDYNTLFAQHRYSESYDAAAKTAGSMHPLHRDQASLVAGLSARALDRTEDAKRWLTPLTSNADAGIAGQASAALGAIATEEGRHRDAAPLFLAAGSKLKGDDAAHAYMYAGDSLNALGKPLDARAAYLKAQGLVAEESSLRASIGDRLAGSAAGVRPVSGSRGGFTLQTGAFSTRQKAQSEAAKLAKRGAVRTVPIRDRSGRTLYAVQVGQFASKQDAARFSRDSGLKGIVAAYE